jgi:hypothetical protein
MLSKEEKCVPGCMHFTGGEVRHHKDCPFYPESLSKKYDLLDEQLNQGKWISVKDELPEDGEYVLGYYYNGCDIFQFNGGFFLINLNRNRDITHWQPLPNPPKQ